MELLQDLRYTEYYVRSDQEPLQNYTHLNYSQLLLLIQTDLINYFTEKYREKIIVTSFKDDSYLWSQEKIESTPTIYARGQLAERWRQLELPLSDHPEASVVDYQPKDPSYRYCYYSPVKRFQLTLIGIPWTEWLELTPSQQDAIELAFYQETAQIKINPDCFSLPADLLALFRDKSNMPLNNQRDAREVPIWKWILLGVMLAFLVMLWWQWG